MHHHRHRPGAPTMSLARMVLTSGRSRRPRRAAVLLDVRRTAGGLPVQAGQRHADQGPPARPPSAPSPATPVHLVPPPREYPDQYAGGLGPVEVLPAVACVGSFRSTALDPTPTRSLPLRPDGRLVPAHHRACRRTARRRPRCGTSTGRNWRGTTSSRPVGNRRFGTGLAVPGSPDDRFPVRDLLRRQFDLTWALFEYHLDRLRARGLPVGARAALLDGTPDRRRHLGPGLGGHRARPGPRTDHRLGELAHRLVVERHPRPRRRPARPATATTSPGPAPGNPRSNGCATCARPGSRPWTTSPTPTWTPRPRSPRRRPRVHRRPHARLGERRADEERGGDRTAAVAARRGLVTESRTKGCPGSVTPLRTPAVGVGFEPTVTSLPRRFSRPFP